MKCKHCKTDIDNRGDCPWGCNQDEPTMLEKCLVPIPDCRRCGTPMNFGQAIPTAIVDMGDGQFTEGRWVGEPPILAVWKCPKCGHSFLPTNAASEAP